VHKQALSSLNQMSLVIRGKLLSPFSATQPRKAHTSRTDSSIIRIIVRDPDLPCTPSTHDAGEASGKYILSTCEANIETKVDDGDVVFVVNF
jgi:hypothetical protein